jgi:hypothetical protein
MFPRGRKAEDGNIDDLLVELSINLVSRANQEEYLSRKTDVMESYQAWFGEGPELSVRLLSLFDRPADGKAPEALLRPPAIRSLNPGFAVSKQKGEREIFLALNTRHLRREKFG